MGTAIVGLIGALIGAATVLIGALLSDRRQTRCERLTWLRDQRAAGYTAALRSLVRINGHQTMKHNKHLAKASSQGLVDEVLEARAQLEALGSLCSSARGNRIRQATEALERALKLISADNLADSQAATNLAFRLVAEVARADLGDPDPQQRLHPVNQRVAIDPSSSQ
jgi:hypothetical protein